MGEKLAEKIIRGKQGFSLAELLVALLITSLSGLVVMGGIGVTTRLFQDVLLHSQTQLVMKEYMSELRAGFLSADIDSNLKIVVFDPEHEAETSDPVFAHSGLNCPGYYMVVPSQGAEEGMGAIRFQPAEYNYENNTASKTGENLPASLPLISTRLSDDFPASLSYRYDGDKFIVSLTVWSKGCLSTGDPVELSTEGIEIRPSGK